MPHLPAPDQILSNPRRTCGSIAADECIDADEKRRSPDILPSLSQITGQTVLSLTSILGHQPVTVAASNYTLDQHRDDGPPHESHSTHGQLMSAISSFVPEYVPDKHEGQVPVPTDIQPEPTPVEIIHHEQYVHVTSAPEPVSSEPEIAAAHEQVPAAPQGDQPVSGSSNEHLPESDHPQSGNETHVPDSGSHHQANILQADHGPDLGRSASPALELNLGASSRPQSQAGEQAQVDTAPSYSPALELGLPDTEFRPYGQADNALRLSPALEHQSHAPVPELHKALAGEFQHLPHGVEDVLKLEQPDTAHLDPAHHHQPVEGHHDQLSVPTAQEAAAHDPHHDQHDTGTDDHSHNSGSNSSDCDLSSISHGSIKQESHIELRKLSEVSVHTKASHEGSMPEDSLPYISPPTHQHGKTPPVPSTQQNIGQSGSQKSHSDISHPTSTAHSSSVMSSVDRDYTFHKSRMWPGIVTMTLERELPAAKKMVIFNNENPMEAGHKFVMSTHAYSTWGQVLDEWTRKIRPRFGKITRVFTPVHGREIDGLSKLKDDSVYIVAGGPHVKKNPRFPPARRVNSDAVRRLFHPPKAIKKSLPIQHAALVRRSETLPPLVERKLFDSAVPMNVFRNGDVINPAMRIVLKGYDLYNMQMVMDSVGHKIRPRTGAVRHLVTMGGRDIAHVKDILPNGFYVILGVGEKFIKDVPYRANGVHEDFIKPKSNPTIARRLFKAPPQDVHRYPISKLLQMSDISLVNAGFLPQHQHANGYDSTLAHGKPVSSTKQSLTSTTNHESDIREEVPPHGPKSQESVSGLDGGAEHQSQQTTHDKKIRT